MRLIYRPNPLATSIELDEHEKKLLLEKCRFNHLDEFVTELHYKAHYGEGVKKEDITFDRWLSQKAQDEINEEYEMLLQELSTGIHIGDCTSVPMSCSKCIAEDMLSTCTLPAGKTVNYYIARAFAVHDTIDGALMWLEDKDLEKSETYTGERNYFAEAITILKSHKEKL